MTVKPSFILIGATDHLLLELGRTLIQNQFEVLAIVSAGSRVFEIPGLKRKIRIPADGEEAFIKYLVKNPNVFNEINGVFIWSSDAIMRQALESDLSEPIKTKILPIKELAARKMLDSKVGQIELFRECGVGHPRTVILNKSSELIKEVIPIGPIFLKSDRGSGGMQVREMEQLHQSDLDQLSEAWFPLVLQEKINGEPVAVEAFFNNGKLVWWIYSIPNSVQSKHGPSMSRLFQIPKNQDFVETLSKIGKAGNVSGFVNASFVKDPESGQTLIFEFDARPNIWHFSFDFFRIPFKEAITGDVQIPCHPELEVPRYHYDPYRLFNNSINKLELKRALSVLRGLKLEGYGEPIPSSFYLKSNLFRRSILLMFFPVFQYRIPVVNLARRMKRRMRNLNPVPLCMKSLR